MLNKTNLARGDLNLLVLFEAVLEERHVGRAAERLNVSPSAVSHGLARLRRLFHDPLFLRHPKGVVPTARAATLAPQIADVLSRAHQVIASAEPFDPKTSTRRFTLGAPDGVSAVLLPPLLAEIKRTAPGVNLAIRNIVAQFHTALTALDEGTLDAAMIPCDHAPSRFVMRTLYEEEFVIVKRTGHWLGNAPTLAEYCAAQHLIVSLTGDPHGVVDELLAQHGMQRRVALTVPNFMQALAVIAESDLIAVLPGRFVATHAAHYRVSSAKTPIPVPTPPIRVVVTRAATADAGLAWLLDTIERAAKTGAKAKRRVR